MTAVVTAVQETPTLSRHLQKTFIYLLVAVHVKGSNATDIQFA